MEEWGEEGDAFSRSSGVNKDFSSSTFEVQDSACLPESNCDDEAPSNYPRISHKQDA